MTQTSAHNTAVDRPEDLVTLTIDDVEVSVPPGTLVIRAAELVGVQIPRFCDHPLLDPVGACRQCLVEIPDAGNGRPIPKPQASCTLPVAAGMVVHTQVTSAVADKAQQGIMEFLLLNHPLDCPMCDKGGECPLQNQAMTNGRAETRFVETKRTFPKPINISAQVLLDRERCVLCARCTRFSAQIAGDPFIELLERGALQQVGIYEREPFESYFSGNTIQICPVGALTSADYRFRARPFDLVSVPSVCEHCASGCALRTDHRRNKVMRRLSGDDPEVNEEWNCDKGRFGFASAGLPDRLTHPLVRDADTGELRVASWPEALAVAARGLTQADGVGVLPGGRVSIEDAYAYQKLARTLLGTNDVDFRARAHSTEEADFLAATVAGRGRGVTYADLEHAPAVLLAGFDPEEESPIVFLRLRKAVRGHGARVWAITSHVTSGLHKLDTAAILTRPGDEARALAGLAGAATEATRGEEATACAAALDDRAVILAGERLAESPGALTAVARLVRQTGARLAWVPRRAGERGALDAGCLPDLLPGGRPVADAAARVDVGTVWGSGSLPTSPGRDVGAMLAAAEAGDLPALLVGGVEVADLPNPALARRALEATTFLVSLEVRRSEVTERADVVLPVAAVAEKAGTFSDWEGRERPFEAVFADSPGMADCRVLAMLADEVGAGLGFHDVAGARRELAELGAWDGDRVAPPERSPAGAADARDDEVVLATWRTLLDGGRLLDGAPHLAATARRPLARVSPATAGALGVADGSTLRVATSTGEITLPVSVEPMADGVVWAPSRVDGHSLREVIGAGSGDVVRLAAGGEG